MKSKKLCAYLLFGSIIVSVGLAAKARGEIKHGPTHDK
jgi:hypothetical protein